MRNIYNRNLRTKAIKKSQKNKIKIEINSKF